jgi:recombinational DNA repair protein (RecF pathway)
MAAKWVEKIKARLQANPLHYAGSKAPTATQHLMVRLAKLEGTEIATCICAKCGGTGKKVPLYAVTNYGNEFNHCYVCGEKYT